MVESDSDGPAAVMATEPTEQVLALEQAELPLDAAAETVAAQVPAEVSSPRPGPSPRVSTPTAEITTNIAVQAAPKTSGITATGRAINDPRIQARPVGLVEITTARRPLFGDFVAPPVVPKERIVQRAGNDPRGPVLQEQHYAEASGQS
jgi:ribonuclease E